jgi:large subunit ribosomal protein L32
MLLFAGVAIIFTSGFRCSQKRRETARMPCDEDEEKRVGALPKKRQTNSRQGHRRQHHKIKLPQLKICPQCKQARLSHHACPNCGTYRGRQVFPVRERRAAAE